MVRALASGLAGCMPPVLARFRRALARLLDGRVHDPDGVGLHVVPLRIRATTADGAALRLLVEVRLEAGPRALEDREQFVHAVTTPAIRHWIEELDLAHAETLLAPSLADLASRVREPLAELGMVLVEIRLVAAEHLLTPSASGPADGAE